MIFKFFFFSSKEVHVVFAIRLPLRRNLMYMRSVIGIFYIAVGY